MNNKVFSAILFTAGAAIGSVVTWRFLKNKYERIAQEEINSVKEEFSCLARDAKKHEDCKNTNASQNEDCNSGDTLKHDDVRSVNLEIADEERVEYSRIANRYRSNYDEEENDEEGGNGDEVSYVNGPYVISPDEFDSSPPGYSLQTLDYFADGVLADGWGVRADIEDTIGKEALNHFGDYVTDIVYVRNEEHEIDYEVTQDPRTYEEAIRTNPNPYYAK